MRARAMAFSLSANAFSLFV
jgi:hypothetical protein